MIRKSCADQMITRPDQGNRSTVARSEPLWEEYRRVRLVTDVLFNLIHLDSDLPPADPKARMTLEVLTKLNLDDKSFPNHSCAEAFGTNVSHLLVKVQHSGSLWTTPLTWVHAQRVTRLFDQQVAIAALAGASGHPHA